MKTKYAVLLSSLFCLIAGFTVGWFGHSNWSHISGADEHADHTAGQLRESGTKPNQMPFVVSVSSHTSDTPKSLTLERLRTLSWLKKSGLYLNIPVFSGNSLNQTFLRVFDLSPREKATLETETRKAKQ